MIILARERVINLPEGATEVGRFSVEMTIANNDDIADARRGKISADQVRKVTIEGIVDTGASRLVLPTKVAKELGLPMTGKARVKYADQRTAERAVAEAVYVEIQGRHGTVDAVLEPKRKDALIGALVLETLDFVVDCLHGKLLRRDPTMILAESE